jgi:hypothetical protein
METKKMPPVPAAWDDDCQGKKDYDGRLVSLSTRYWPRGGGWWMLEPGKGLNENPTPDVKPSAHATIYLGSCANDFYDDAVPLAEAKFEDDTQEAVQRAVEAWAKEQYTRIGAALAREFGLELSSEGRSS